MFRLVILASVLSLAYGASLRPISRDVQSRIVDGDLFDIANVPWQAAIEYDLNGEALFYLICGGTIISDKFIMISYYCLSGHNTARMRARVGSSSQDTGGATYSIRNSKTHPNFNSSTRDYDVSVFETFDTISLGGNVRRATLPALGEPVLVNSEGYASGWGPTHENSGGGGMILLRKVDITVLDQDECSAAYEGYRAVTDRMFCAGGKGFGTCDSDKGGPYVLDGVVVGITSWSQGCGRVGNPDVFTKVSAVLEWIQEQIS